MDRREHPHLSIDISAVNGHPLIKISGTLDGWHYQAIEKSLRSQVRLESDAIVVDLSGLTFASIGGMYALVEALRSVQYDVKVYAVATGDVSRVLHRTRFDLRIGLCASLDEAITLVLPDDSGLAAKLFHLSDDDEELPKAA